MHRVGDDFAPRCAPLREGGYALAIQIGNRAPVTFDEGLVRLPAIDGESGDRVP